MEARAHRQARVPRASLDWLNRAGLGAAGIGAWASDIVDAFVRRVEACIDLLTNGDPMKVTHVVRGHPARSDADRRG